MRNTYSAITVVTGLTTVYCRTPSLHLKSNTLVEKESGSHPHLSIHPLHCDPMVFLLLLSHGPWWAAAQWGQVRLLLLDLQHEHQAGVLVTEEVQQKHQEVVDDVGLIALPACVHVDGQTRIAKSQPLVDREEETQTAEEGFTLAMQTWMD